MSLRRIQNSVLVSFVVLAYNVEETIERCLKSIQQQTVSNFEVIVVNDASTDNTLSAAMTYVDGDARFSFIDKPINQGSHLARKSGVAATHGSLVYFVDGDDEISPYLVEFLSTISDNRRVDIIRFGVDVIAEGQENQETLLSMGRMYNSATGRDTGSEILKRTYSDAHQPRDSWSVVACAYEGALCRSAFHLMTNERLDYLEDAYQFFVLASQANALVNATDFRALKYHHGTGRSGRSFLPLSTFEKNQRSIRAICDCALSYSLERGIDAEVESARWLQKKCLEILSIDWTHRLSLDNQVRAMDVLFSSWGELAVDILIGPLLGRATWVDSNDCLDDGTFAAWRTAFSRLESHIVKGKYPERYNEYHSVLCSIDEKAKQRDELRAEQLRIEEDAHRKQEEAARAIERRNRKISYRLFNFVFPSGSRGRRAISAFLREMNSPR